MPEITEEEVRRIARLARIHLQEGEVGSLREQLGRILEVFSLLQAADLESLPAPPASSDSSSPRRPDRPTASLPRREALSQAPDTADGHVRIPKVLG